MIFPSFEWVDAGGRFRLAIMPRPDPDRLDEHLGELRAKGVDVLVSMLQEEEAIDLGLAGEPEACARTSIAFYNHPVPDHDVPADRARAEVFARVILSELQANKGVVIHCYAGIGRSATMAATIMMMAGFDLEDACLRLSAARRVRVPETREQLEWLLGVARTEPGA